MRLLTGLILPEEEALNRKAIGRGERAKAEAEQAGPKPLLLEMCLTAGPGNEWCLQPDGHKGPCSWRKGL